MLIDGLHIPLTTPFYRDGKSYLRKLEHNVARYSLTPAAGLVALSGEGSTLTDAERREALEAVGHVAAREKVLVAALPRESVVRALDLAEEAERAGFDAVLLGAAADAATLTEAERMLWFHAVADRSPLPVMLSSEAASELATETITELAQHGNIIGIYDAQLTRDRLGAILSATQNIRREVTVTPVFAPVTRRMLAPQIENAPAATFVSAESLAGGSALAIAAVAPPSAPSLKIRTKMVGFQVMAAGRVTALVELLEAGTAGAMPALSASAPQACYEAYAAFRDGDPALAAEKAHRLLAADALIAHQGIAAVKYGCDLNGYFGGIPRLPRLPLTADGRAAVERVLASLKN
jgi:4-hydroxy-2-oxoglutarate aldolase